MGKRSFVVPASSPSRHGWGFEDEREGASNFYAAADEFVKRGENLTMRPAIFMAPS